MRRIECQFPHLSFSWPGGHTVLDDLHGIFPLEGVVALCGPNGGGKSTLLDLLTGALDPTSGSLRLVGASGDSILLVRQRIEAQDSSPGERQSERLGEALRKDDAALLVLDEPTNHLDRDGLALLESRLRRRRGPTLLVSHDRDLLDRLATATWWLERGALTATEGGFTAAWEARERRLSERLEAREAHDARRRAVEVRLQRAHEAKQQAHGQRTAGGRMKDAHDRDATSMAADFKFRKAQARMGQDARRLGRERDRLEADETISVQRDTLRDIEFPWSRELAGRRLSLPAGRLEGPGGSGVDHAGIALDGRSRLRLEGPNGSGKSTVLAALAALEKPGVAYLPQEPSRDDDLAFLERLRGEERAELGRILSLAAALGASGGALRATSSPSPGEARKLRLAAMLASPSWLLLLDEPTNHLDAASIQRLQEALARWPGALVLATHDARLARTLELVPWTLREGRLAQG